MIPLFPIFKKLELTDRVDVENLTSKYPPYSDFNFSSMWAWDLKGEMGLSILNGNLVVKFSDYIDGQTFLSFLGDNMVNETAKELIKFSEKNYKINLLELIPEITVNLLDKKEFDFTPDIDSHDYIYSVKHLSNINNWQGHNSSKSIRKFLKLHPDYEVKNCLLQDIAKDEYTEIFEKWAIYKNMYNFPDFNEYQAFKRFLEIKNDKIKVVSIYKNKLLIGFTMYEICSDSYAISHFIKTDLSCKVSDILDWEEAKFLEAHGMQYVNWQQDLGILGLRKSKESYKPDSFLNKYIVKKHTQ